MAAGPGIEPGLDDPESPVLPLHHPAIIFAYIVYANKIAPSRDFRYTALPVPFAQGFLFPQDNHDIKKPWSHGPAGNGKSGGMNDFPALIPSSSLKSL